MVKSVMNPPQLPPEPDLDWKILLLMAREMEYSFQNQTNLEGRVWANRLINYIRDGVYEYKD